MSGRRVVISGLGAITAVGHNSDIFWRACLNGETSVESIPQHWYQFWQPKSTCWSPLPLPDYSLFGLRKYDLMQYDIASLNAIAATKEALSNAGFEVVPQTTNAARECIHQEDPYNIGVFLGTSLGGIWSLLSNYAAHCQQPLREYLPHGEQSNNLNSDLCDVDRALLSPGKINTFGATMSISNAIAAAVGIKFGIKGPVNVYVCACASGTAAIGNAYQAIVRGDIDMAISGGSDYAHDDFGALFRGFDAVRALVTSQNDPKSVNRPFDSERSGFLYSEGGTGVLILEELSHLQKRQKHGIAEICGYAESFDSHSIISIDTEGVEIRRMIHKVLESAKMQPSDIHYINAHGTGTQVNDRVEAKIISDIFGRRPLVNSTKSILGHTLGASGALEALVCARSILEGRTHACVNLDNPIEALNFAVNSEKTNILTALSLSYAFGGHNAALLLKSII